MNQGQKYWNPYIETLPREDLHRLQLKKFKRIFQWAYTHSKFYRRLYEKAGVTPADITTLNDIRRVPKVDKSMMRDIQGKAPFLYGDALCVPLEEVVEFRQTSGTTGQPVYQPDTWQDWEWWAECWAYILWAQGYRPCDRSFRLLKGGVLGRADDITKVKGVLLSPAAIEEVVRSIDGLGDEYEVIVDRLGDIDRIKLKVEIAPGYENMAKRLETVLKDQLRLKTNLGNRIEFYDHGKLPRYEVKAKRFKDLRKGSLHSRRVI